MKRNIAVVATFAFLITSTSQVSAAPKIGSACIKLSTFQQSSSTLLVCDVVKKKKVWRKANTIEKSLYQREKNRLERAAAQKIIDDTAAALAEIEAAEKLAAEKAAADVPKLVIGQTYSGQDTNNPEWKWVALRVSNSALTKIYSHRYFDVFIANASGAVVDKSLAPFFPIIRPGKSEWFTTTSFSNAPISQVVLQPVYSTTPSPFTVSELPTVSNIGLVTSSYYATRKMVSFTIKNNSSQVLSDGSQGFAVLLDSSNTPVYAVSGRLGVMVLPGGSAEVTIGSDFTFNGSYSSIEVSIFPAVK